MRMNISVPDELAEEVRPRYFPISAVCQRALREEVDRLRLIEDADDILVYVESEQADPDLTSWPGFTVGKPTLTYKRYRSAPPRAGLGARVRERRRAWRQSPDDFTAGVPGDPPIEWAREFLPDAAAERNGSRRWANAGNHRRGRRAPSPSASLAAGLSSPTRTRLAAEPTPAPTGASPSPGEDASPLHRSLQ